MSKITYTDKEYIYKNDSIPEINKITDVNMNEIKRVVNENDTRLTTVETDIDNLNTYSTTEQIIGKWIDGKHIYRKVIVDTTAHNANDIYNIAHGVNNIETLIMKSVMIYQNATTVFDGTTTSPLTASERVTSYLNGSNIAIRSSWESIKTQIILTYTKKAN